MRTRKRVPGSHGALLLLVLGLGTALACSGDSPTAPVQQPGPPPQAEVPIASFTASNLTNSNVVAFTNRSTGATGFLWNFGDGETSEETNPVHDYGDGAQGVGLYAVTLTAAGLLSSSQLVKQVEVGVSAEFTCIQVAAREVQFVNQSKNADRYVWSFGDGAESKGISPIHKFQGSGSWAVELFAIRSNQEDRAARQLVRADDGTFSCDTDLSGGG